MVLLYLDPGHGGKDPGAVGNGLKEKDIVLDICLRIRDELDKYEDIKVIMSRADDSFPTLEERTREANSLNADAFLSVHINSSGNPTSKGFETFTYLKTSPATVALQNVIHGEILKQIGDTSTDRGKKKANYHVLRVSKMKSVLTENLFISNPAEAKLLDNSAYRQKLAMGHVIGLEKFFGLKKKVIDIPKNEKKLYYVQIAAFESKERAEELVKQLRREGYKPFIKYE